MGEELDRVRTDLRHSPESELMNTETRQPIEAVVVSERQAALIFESLKHARSTIAKEPGDEIIEYELTEAMRLFVWRR